MISKDFLILIIEPLNANSVNVGTIWVTVIKRHPLGKICSSRACHSPQTDQQLILE